MAAETERVVQGYTNFLFASGVGREIEITFLVRIIEIDRRWNHAITDGQSADCHLNRPGSAEEMTRHRFGGANRDALGALTECGLDRARLGHIAQAGRGRVRIDV